MTVQLFFHMQDAPDCLSYCETQKTVTSCEEYFTYVSAHGEKTPAIL